MFLSLLQYHHSTLKQQNYWKYDPCAQPKKPPVSAENTAWNPQYILDTQFIKYKKDREKVL